MNKLNSIYLHDEEVCWSVLEEMDSSGDGLCPLAALLHLFWGPYVVPLPIGSRRLNCHTKDSDYDLILPMPVRFNVAYLGRTVTYLSRGRDWELQDKGWWLKLVIRNPAPDMEDIEIGIHTQVNYDRIVAAYTAAACRISLDDDLKREFECLRSKGKKVEAWKLLNVPTNDDQTMRDDGHMARFGRKDPLRGGWDPHEIHKLAWGVMRLTGDEFMVFNLSKLHYWGPTGDAANSVASNLVTNLEGLMKRNFRLGDLIRPAHSTQV